MRLSDMIHDLLPQTEGHNHGALNITGLTSDSRKVQPGFLFAALPGSQADGRAFIPDALEKGAAAVLAPPGTPLEAGHSSVPLIHADNPRRRYALLAARFFGAQPATVAVVTGTNGKTSVASFLRQIWTQAGLLAASAGTLGLQSPAWSRDDGLTTPDPVDLHADLARLAKEGVTHLALEASSHGLDQHRLDGVVIQAAGFTNLTRDHLDYHGSLDDYFAAKMRLFSDLLDPAGTAVVMLSGDVADQVVETVRGRGIRLITVGYHRGDIQVTAREAHPSGQRLSVTYDGLEALIRLPLVGAFQAENALVALGLAMAGGLSFDVGVRALERLGGARGRLELVGQHASGAAIYVDYAHTPDALVSVLSGLRPHAAARLHVIFGCGGDRDAGKRPEMGRACAEGADVVYLTDDNPRSENPATIRDQAKVGCPDAIEIGDRRQAIREAVSTLQTGDILVVAGKGHEQGQSIGGSILPFDDASEVRAALKEARQ